MDVPHLSNHSAVHCTLRLEKTPNVRLNTTNRSYKHVCVAAICGDRLSESLSGDLIYAVDTHNTCLTAIIHKHAPIKIHTVIIRPHTPWYNDDIRPQKRLRRQLESKWRKSGMESVRLAYCQLVTSIIHTAKLEYHKRQITCASGDQRQRLYLLRSCYTLITIYRFRRANHSTRLQRVSPAIRSRLTRNANHVDSHFGTALPVCQLTVFEPASHAEINNLLQSSPVKKCELDPFPTWLLRDCAREMVPLLTFL